MNQPLNEIGLLAIAALAFGIAGCDEKPVSTNDTTYPLETCVVSGEPLGSMGTPVEVSHEGTTVKLCCKNCIEDFNADPSKFAALVTGE
tara:strand:+ start:695 stop:961 length:267 start_codon:yes stop_codon:yes gene_type:complete